VVNSIATNLTDDFIVNDEPVEAETDSNENVDGPSIFENHILEGHIYTHSNETHFTVFFP
jgi:hypothetical protein